jgi:L-serine dehydratase
VTQLEDWPVRLTGDAHLVLAVLDEQVEPAVRELVMQDGQAIGEPQRHARGDQVFLHIQRQSPLDTQALASVRGLPGVHSVWTAPPVFFVRRGQPLFGSAAEMVALAEQRGCSLGQIAMAYESALLGLPERDILDEMIRRLEVMQAAVHHEWNSTIRCQASASVMQAKRMAGSRSAASTPAQQHERWP